MKNWAWPLISKIVTVTFCLVSLSSVTLTYLSAIYRLPWAFYLGSNILVWFWVFNPMGLIVPILGAVFTGKKKPFLWQIAVNTAVWMLCTVSMASLF